MLSVFAGEESIAESESLRRLSSLSQVVQPRSYLES